MFDDPEFPDLAAQDPRSYDELDFEERDQIDAQVEVDYRALRYGLPARPGTRR